MSNVRPATLYKSEVWRLRGKNGEIHSESNMWSIAQRRKMSLELDVGFE